MSDNGESMEFARTTAEHVIYGFIVATLSSQMQIKFANASPYETQYALFYTFVASVLLYGGASACQMQLRAERSPPLPLVIYSRLLAGAVSVVVALLILELNVLGWIVSAAFFAKGCYDIRFFLWNCLRIAGGYIVSKWKSLVGLYKGSKNSSPPATLPGQRTGNGGMVDVELANRSIGSVSQRVMDDCVPP